MTYPLCVLSPEASPAMSDRYVHVNSMDVINAMTSEGFVVDSIKADNPQKRDPRFVRHLIDFRLPNAPKIHDATPRILFTNSHNGRTKAHVLAGIFRFVCSNGMVVGDTTYSEHIRHAGDTARELIGRMIALSKNSAPLFEKIERWTHINIKPTEQLIFAQRAMELRFGESAKSYDLHDLLAVRREEDRGDDVWRVLNRIQENAVRGGMIGRNANNRFVQSRGITGIANDLKFNQGVWELAEEFAR
jgi:hypothetical protein